MVDKSRGYNLPKALCIRGRTQGFENMQERSDNNPPNDLVDRKESDVSIYVQPEEEIMQKAPDFRNILIIRELKYKEL